MARRDPHSYNDDTQPEVEHLTWNARVDFGAQRIEAGATLRFRAAAAGPVDLDTRDLEILEVRRDGPAGPALTFQLAPAEPILGSRLRIELPAQTAAVHIRYRTSPQASALQWLQPAQTSGGKQPFLYSQCQAIHARSVIPIQDTPRIRIRYEAQLDVPAHLRSLMAAAQLGREPGGSADRAVDRFRMDQPIPPYLFAFAVGDLASRELGPRSRVWAEPGVVEAAAWEFAAVDEILRAAERLLGPYDWERFDLLTLPPAFPYGGMENPRLTFLTPSLLAKDRSMVNVVAHELAHSWTGNLVTNASAEDFWLNEGFTVFVERKILEAVEGSEMAALHAAVGRQVLDEAIEQFQKRPELTRLRTHLQGVDPDDAYSTVPYEKGCLFLMALEAQVGVERFAKFLRAYMERFRFQSLTTAQFLDFTEAELPGALAAIHAETWIDGEGVPGNAPAPRSARLEAIARIGQAAPPEAMAKNWSPTEWQLYLKQLKAPLAPELVAELDRTHALTARTNLDVLVAWLELAVRSNHAPAIARAEQVLGEVGRAKYLKPLYAALSARPETRPLAVKCFERYRAGYHPIAAAVISARLAASA